MAGKKFSELNAATEANNADLLAAAQDKGGGVLETRKLTLAQVLLWLRGNLGTAASEDVTTSTTDTTAGRLLKVGDFGLGAPVLIPSSSDLENYNRPGFYFWDTGVDNAPFDYGTMIVTARGATRFQQTVYSSVASDTNPVVRYLLPSGWTGWFEIHTSRRKIETDYMPEVDGDPLIKAKDAAKLSGGADANFTNMPRVGGDDLIKYKDSFATNQGWVDVKSSRSVNTNYTNTTGKPLAVLISMDHPSSSAYNQSNMIVDGAVVGVVFHGGGGLRIIHPIFVIVPNGKSYKLEVQGTDAPTVYVWHEYR